MFRQLAYLVAVALLSCAALAQQAPDAGRPTTDSSERATPDSSQRPSPGDERAATPDRNERPKVGLVLSGGGARGLAHIGVLKVLHELNVPVDVIAGTSMGSIVGGAYAAGYTPAYLEHLSRRTNWSDIFSRRAPRARLHFRRKQDDYRNLSDIEFGLRAGGLSLPRGAVAAQNLGLFLRGLSSPLREVNDLARLPIPFAAVATDLATGKQVVLQKGVSLASALSASTSVPGAFAPFDYRGRALVDGGLVNNVPVDVARAMGAQIIIAVNVGAPLAAREKLTDVLSVSEQVINLLTEQNVEKSLAELKPADILIRPELENIGASDFNEAESIIAAGEAAARALADRLRALAVPAEEFAVRENARIGALRDDRPQVIDEVRIEGLRTVNPAAVRAELDVPLGKPLSPDDLARIMQRVYGRGDFEAVSYSVVDEADAPERTRRVLVVTPLEKAWGYNTLRFGGNVQSNFRDDNTFNLLAAHTWSWLNLAGGEWRNEVQIGEQRRLATEFFQPLAPGSRWFLLPRAWSQREKFDLFVASQPVSRFENVTRAGEVQFGYELPLGTVSVGYGWSRTETRLLIGPTVLPPARTDAATASAELWLDTLDTINFPHHGFTLGSRYTRYDSEVGSSNKREALSFDASAPVTFGRYTVLFSVRGASAVQEGAVKLGGLFNLSGTPFGAVSGSRGLLIRAQGYRNVSDAFGDIRMPVYAGFSLEAGNAVARDASLGWSDLRRAMALYVGADSLVGPVYLAVGRTIGGASGFYLLWGRPQ